MKKFKLEIITPTTNKTFFVNWIKASSPTGDFFIGPEHSDLISILKNKSKLIYQETKSKSEIAIDIFHGIIKIHNGQCTIIMNYE